MFDFIYDYSFYAWVACICVLSCVYGLYSWAKGHLSIYVQVVMGIIMLALIIIVFMRYNLLAATASFFVLLFAANIGSGIWIKLYLKEWELYRKLCPQEFSWGREVIKINMNIRSKYQKALARGRISELLFNDEQFSLLMDKAESLKEGYIDFLLNKSQAKSIYEEYHKDKDWITRALNLFKQEDCFIAGLVTLSCPWLLRDFLQNERLHQNLEPAIFEAISRTGYIDSKMM